MFSRVKFISLIIALAAVLAIAGSSFAAIDPLHIGVGARPLGMGKAYVAVAEDGDAIFVNPAGLGKIDKPKLTSMYTNLMNDAQYVLLGGAYPTKGLGAFGGGAVSANVSDISLYTDSFIPDGKASYGNHVFFLSYGVGLENLRIPYISEIGDDIYVGTNIKYFMQGGTGNASIEAGDGTGFDLDLGLLYTPLPWLSFGACGQNILPKDAGGKVVFKSGLEEGIPSNVKVGMRLGIIGSGLYEIDGHELDLALDFDMSSHTGIPGATYLGLEYKPLDMLTIRAGANSAPSPYDAPINITGGIGFRYDGIEFNYAYHPFDNIPDNASHFFSISFVGQEEKVEEIPPPPPPKKELKLNLKSPIDRSITYDRSVDVDGEFENYEPGILVKVNGEDVAVDESGNILTSVPLSTYGKNLIKVTAQDKDGKEKTFKARLLRLVSFGDVINNYWARKPIEYGATVGLIEGYPDGTFKPERALSRAELAALLVRARGIELPERIDKRVFSDIPTTHWASRYIKAATEMGLVEGYPDGTFRPNNKINRAEGVLVLARFEGLIGKQEVEVGPYPDIPKIHWAASLVSAAKDAGFLDYMIIYSFEPKRDLSRAEAAEILSKTTFAKKKIDRLLNWNIGFEEGGPAKEPEAELKTFKDVPLGYWAAKPIQALGTIGIISGYPNGTYKPEKTLTRAELSALLVKAKNIKPAKVNRALFSDLPLSHWASGYVKRAIDIGLVRGYPGGTFKPDKNVSRAEAVTVLSRFDNFEVPLDVWERPFPDVEEDHWSARYVTAARDQGMLEYLEGKKFEPNRSVTRAEAAEMLSRTNFGEQRIVNELGQEFVEEFTIKYTYRESPQSYYIEISE